MATDVNVTLGVINVASYNPTVVANNPTIANVSLGTVVVEPHNTVVNAQFGLIVKDALGNITMDSRFDMGWTLIDAMYKHSSVDGSGSKNYGAYSGREMAAVYMDMYYQMNSPGSGFHPSVVGTLVSWVLHMGDIPASAGSFGVIMVFVR